MRLATKIFLLLFGLFFATISLDIAAQYYFYDFAYPSYKQNQIYQLVYDIKEEVPNFERHTNDFFSYMNELKSEYLVQYKLHSSNTSQLNLDRLTDNDIFFESKNEENVTTYHYYTKITFKGGEQWIIEVSYSLQVLGEMLSVFTNYYIFIFMILAILVLFFAIWLTEHITKPLLHMKRVTENIANINFTEKCEVTSDDELKELATNINIMSDNLKTIKELSDELGVSKTAINKKVTDRERKLWFSKIGNKFVINEDGQKSIKRMFEGLTENQESKTENLEQKPNSQTENFRNNNENNADIKYILDIIEYQKEQIKDLQNTKDEQFKQLSNMQNLLDQQQRLALQDKKLLEEYKSEINELKALKMPQEDMKDGSSIRGEAQEEIERLKAQLKLSEEERNKAKEKEPVKTESKKWWQRWK